MRAAAAILTTGAAVYGLAFGWVATALPDTLADGRQAQVRAMLSTDVAVTMGGTLVLVAALPLFVGLTVSHSGAQLVWLLPVLIGGFLVAVLSRSVWLVAGPRYRPQPTVTR